MARLELEHRSTGVEAYAVHAFHPRHRLVLREPDRDGAIACLEHVITYTATQALALAVVQRATGMRLSWRRAALGLAVSAVTHYIADRQGGHWRDENPRGIVRLASGTGHAGWLKRDPNAGYLMDQAWHKGWIAVAAALAAGGGR